MGRKEIFTAIALSSLLSLATAVSLASFQQIPSNVQVPLGCSLAYASSIPFCQVSDFTNGAACSAGCQSSLVNVALSINKACAGVVVDGSTLLGKVFQGQLVNVLCPNAAPATSPAKATTAVEKTTTAPLTTATAPANTLSSVRKTTAPPSTSQSISTLQASSGQSSSLQSTGNALGDPSASPTSNQQKQTATASSASSTKTSETVQSPKYPSALEQQLAAIRNSGGGSPFDFISPGTSNALPRREILIGYLLGLLLILTR